MSADLHTSGEQDRAPSKALVAGVLIGGRSRRFGRPKALLRRSDGTSFVEHVVRMARAVAGEVVLLGDGPTPLSMQSMRVLPDACAHAGPLSGLCTLLEYAGKRLALLLACDMPNLRSTLLWKLYAHVDPTQAVVTFGRSDAPRVFHACCAIYSPRTLGVVRKSLADSELRMQSLLARLPIVSLVPTATEAFQLSNVNTPSELVKLNRVQLP